MELLTCAVVDIATLVATCHALKKRPLECTSGMTLPDKLRSRLRRDLKRGTVAYIDCLARSRRGVVDSAQLQACRLAAERDMESALAQQALLGELMGSEAGSLAGLVAARHDLWRLAHLTLHLSAGARHLAKAANAQDAKAARSLASRLRRRLRKALVAYARATLRTRRSQEHRLTGARAAALACIGPRGAAEAERLAAMEDGSDPSHHPIRSGVYKPLFDLALDWKTHARLIPPPLQ